MNTKKTYPYQNLLLQNLPGEEWKDIFGAEGYYMISNKGRVKSLARTIPTKTGKFTIKEDLILKQHLAKTKYVYNLHVNYRVEGISYTRNTARIVYSTFIQRLPSIKDKRIYVIHKDDDALNNDTENLILMDHSQMIRHYMKLGIIPPTDLTKYSEEKIKKFRDSVTRPIAQYSLEKELISTYASQAEAGRKTGICSTNINGALRGKQKTASGYIWEYI